MTAVREVRAQSVSASRAPVEDCRGPRDRCRWGRRRRRWRARSYRKRGPNRLSDVAVPCDVSDRNAFAGATVLPDGRAGGGGLDCEVWRRRRRWRRSRPPTTEIRYGSPSSTSSPLTARTTCGTARSRACTAPFEPRTRRARSFSNSVW